MDNETQDLFNVGEDEDNRTVIALGTPAYAFLIDCGRDMHQPVNYISTSLQAIRKVVREFIVNSKNMFVTIILMATTKVDNAANVKNVCVLLPLSPAGADVLMKLDVAIKQASSDTFQTEYGLGEFSLCDPLWIATTLLNETKRKLKKEIFLITNNSSSFSRQDSMRIFSIMSDFERNKISFHLVPVGSSYDHQHYKEFLEIAKSPVCSGPVSTVEDMLSRFPPTVSTTRPLTKLKFHITDDVSIAVTVTYLAMRMKPPNSKPLYTATNLPVESETIHKILDPAEDQPPDPSVPVSTENSLARADILRCEIVSGKTIAFTNDEMIKINSFMEPELRLIGFKDMASCISFQLHLQACAFIYPDERSAEGSTTLFTALMKRCEAKNVVAFCSYCPRKTSSNRYVALTPCRDPGGFLAIYLPFGDEVRDVDVSSAAVDCSLEQVDLMKKLINRLRFQYKPENFPNPRLTSHWNAVEALALELYEPEECCDASEPNYEMFRERLGDIPARVLDEIYGGSVLSYGARSTSSQCSTPAEVMDIIAAVQDNFKEDTMEHLNIAQLKTYLKSVGLGAGLSKMKKADLIVEASNHLKINT